MKKYILLVFCATALSAIAQSVKVPLNKPQVKKIGNGVLVYGTNDNKVFKMFLYDKNLSLKKELPERSEAQSVKGFPETPTLLEVEDGLLVYGFNDDRVYKMYLYDKELKLKKEYSKSFNKDVNKHSGYVRLKDGNFEMLFCNNMFCTYGSVLKLNAKLEELSFEEYTKQDKDKFKPYMLDARNDMMGEIFGTSNTETISGANLSWGPHAAAHEEIYNAALQIPGSNERVIIYQSFFDSTAGKFITAGNYFEYAKKQKDRLMKGLALLFMDDKNNILQIKKFEFPDYAFKESGGFDFKDKQEFVNYLIKSKQGTYVLNCTNAARKYIGGGRPVRGGAIPQTTLAWDFYATVGFSYLEFDSNLNQTSSIFYPFENFKDYQTATYGASASEGKTLIFSNAKSFGIPGPINSEILFFSSSPKPLLKTNLIYQDMSYDMQETRNPPVPNQFLMDDNTLLVFVYGKKDDYELKLIKF